ncbi:hypothetical protein J8F10_08625 [Gemmata sp. G18]|uniref:Uncharacterized protein n=1 Tax=Gemmata palustris TaxID=2822762 RepID=A0ABS5BNS9_9BACT|nr:hypothetical protein [Gemmata palustris]MBP3955343.1 hypothetical protein [Gemmata palustris]
MPQVETQLVAEAGDIELAAPTKRREDVIRRSVLAALGRPDRLLKVAVLPLWGNNFRVNVWTATDGAGNGIPNSYFVTADERGGIVRSEPPIQKLY